MSDRSKVLAQKEAHSPIGPASVDRKIVQWLLRYPFQRVEDLELALQVSPNTVYRHLTRLLESGMIEQITPSLGAKMTCRLYYLSNAGLHNLALLENVNARALARTWRTDEQSLLRLLPRLSTLVQLQKLINSLIVYAPAMLTHEKGHRAELAWHWQRDYRQQFPIQEHMITSHSDASLLFVRKARAQSHHADYYCALLLFDPGFEGSNDQQLIVQKLETLLHYRTYMQRLSASRPFPPVLVLVQTAHQREIWQRLAAETAMSLRIAPLEGAIVDIPSQQPIDVAWTLPWQKLSSRATCRLLDLFVPTTGQDLLPGILKQPAILEPASTPTKREHILRGNFSQRARESGEVPGENTEQEEIALLRLCLSYRHLEVLEMLYTHPLLATGELAVLLALRTDSVTRYVYELKRYACVEKYQSYWQLSERGLRFLAASRHLPLRHIAELKQKDGVLEQRGIPHLKKHMHHTQGLYSFFARLVAGSRLQGSDQEVLWWETGSPCACFYTHQGKKYILRPGAAFAYKAGLKRLLAWVEWEVDATSTQTFVTTMQAYARFAATQGWKAVGFQVLPVLLIVVPEKKQVQQMASIAVEHLEHTSLLARITTADNVVKYGPQAQIWHPVTPTCSLHQRLELLNSGQRLVAS